MVALRLIPCLDVARGRVVKGVNFVGLRDAGDPVELACRYSRAGADELVFLDIAASHEGRGTLIDMVRRTAESVTIPFTVGGGISTVEGITELLRAGADKVSLNSSAVRRPELVREGADQFGCQCIVVAIDARRSRRQSSGGSDFVFEEPACGAIAELNNHADSLAVDGAEILHRAVGVLLQKVNHGLGNAITHAGHANLGADRNGVSLGHGLRGLESGATLTVAFAPNRWLLCV